MSHWKWNDVELEVDMEDADFQEKYENAFMKMEKTEENLKKAGKDQNWLKKQLTAHNAKVKETFLLTVDGLDRVVYVKKTGSRRPGK